MPVVGSVLLNMVVVFLNLKTRNVLDVINIGQNSSIEIWKKGALAVASLWFGF